MFLHTYIIDWWFDSFICCWYFTYAIMFMERQTSLLSKWSRYCSEIAWQWASWDKIFLLSQQGVLCSIFTFSKASNWQAAGIFWTVLLAYILVQTIFPKSDSFVPFLKSFSYSKWEQQGGGSLSCNTVLRGASCTQPKHAFCGISRKLGTSICDLPMSSHQSKATHLSVCPQNFVHQW